MAVLYYDTPGRNETASPAVVRTRLVLERRWHATFSYLALLLTLIPHTFSSDE